MHSIDQRKLKAETSEQGNGLMWHITVAWLSVFQVTESLQALKLSATALYWGSECVGKLLRALNERSLAPK